MRQNLNAQGSVSALPTGFLLQFTCVLPERPCKEVPICGPRGSYLFTRWLRGAACGCLTGHVSCDCVYLSDSTAGGLDVDSVSWGAVVQFPLRLCKCLCGCFGHGADDNVLELTWLHLEGLEIKVSWIPGVLLRWRLRRSHASFTPASSGANNHVAAPRQPESLSSLFQTYPS